MKNCCLPKFILGVEDEDCPFVIHTERPAFVARVSEDGETITAHQIEEASDAEMDELLQAALAFWWEEMDS